MIPALHDRACSNVLVTDPLVERYIERLRASEERSDTFQGMLVLGGIGALIGFITHNAQTGIVLMTYHGGLVYYWKSIATPLRDFVKLASTFLFVTILFLTAEVLAPQALVFNGHPSAFDTPVQLEEVPYKCGRVSEHVFSNPVSDWHGEDEFLFKTGATRSLDEHAATYDCTRQMNAFRRNGGVALGLAAIVMLAGWCGLWRSHKTTSQSAA